MPGSLRNQKVNLSLSALPATASAHRLARDILLVVVRERAKHLAFVRRMAPRAEPEDVLQLALLRAARHLDDIREGDRLEAWFWRILRNTIADENERLARETVLLAQVRQGLDEISPQEAASCACSLGVLQQLKPEYAEILRRADIDELPMEQLAHHLGITLNNATVRLHRARKAMRDALLEHCGTDSVRACQNCGCEGEPLRK